MLSRTADFISSRPKRVLAAVLVLAIFAGAVGAGVADRLDPFGADDPATESVKADERLEGASGVDYGASVVALVETEKGVRSTDGSRRVERVAEKLRAGSDVAQVATFRQTGDSAMVSRDGRATYVVAYLVPVPDGDRKDVVDRLEERLGGTPGVKLGGSPVAEAEANEIVSEDLARAEMLAIPLLVLLSFWVFRGFVAALLPPLMGGLSIVGTFLVLRALSETMSVSVFALNLVTGLGLGLAIDYSLFIVSRYREELAAGHVGPEALRRTLATAGRTVLFSSLTVAAAMAALLIFPQRFLYSMGVGGTAVALIAAAVALVALPAMLALLGERVNALSPRWLRRTAQAEAGREQQGAWYRLSRMVMRRPGRIAAISAVVLIAFGTPATGITFTTVDATVLPHDSEPRQVDDALKSRFPAANSTSPLRVVVESPPGPRVERFARELGELPGAARVSEPRPAGPGLALVEVAPGSTPLSDRAQDLVREVRSLSPPFEVRVTGQTAHWVDQKESVGAHVPWAFAIIAGTTLVILFVMTGSVVLPFKALVMNVLTLSAAFGILVLVFQDGRLEGVLDYTSQGALDLSQPIVLFALAFGLSTDYGVFLLSRIKEARDAGAPDSEAVAIGLERTGRIVTAAALLFSVAVGAFATSQLVFIKELGIGTALAVLIDASIVRALLVPSLMELLGRWNWWAPAPLRRLHRRLGLTEGEPAPSGA